ncbi:MAG: arabinosyltransferase domain-containing protein [Labedaea sp.]
METAADTVEGRSDDVATEVPPATDPKRRKRLLTVAMVSGLLAIACAAVLPVAPVNVNQPTVAWPNDPVAPQSTMLTLGAYKPLGIDARFSCAAVAAAAATDGVVLATVDPRQPAAVPVGLLVTAKSGRLTVNVRDQRIVDTAVPSGPCDYRLIGDADGLTVTAGGRTVGSAPADRMPDVDMLVTGAAAIPGATADDLSVRLKVDDRFASSPTAIKIALAVLMLLAAAVAVACLILMDKAIAREPARRRRFQLRVVDVVVPLVMLAWLFLAPATDDDGYYGAMARNATYEGYVGNYYQVYNESFTPFSWFYVFLNFWQRLFGYAPVVLRIPALLFGLVTWWAVRRLVDGRHVLPGALRDTRWGPIFVRAAVAGAFLAWWLPLDMGVRPEGVVTMCGALVLLAVATAVERRRLALVAAAVGIAGLAVLAHPTGFTALAPILAGLPAMWRLIRQHAGPRLTVARIACVLAAGAAGAFVTFFDGTMRDFVRSQAIFRAIQGPETWYTEYLRYQFLLQQDPMGNYAKRAAVLVCIVAMIWFVALTAGARFRRVAVPSRLALAGWSTIGMFLLLWITPSKWTHHFGALSGIGSAFLAMMLVGSVPLVRELTRREKLPVPAVVLGVGSVLAAVALAGHGPNIWPYNWMFGMPQAWIAPHVWKFHADSVLLWALALGVLSYLVFRWARRYKPDWRRYSVLMAVPLLLLAFFVADIGYLVGSFTVAAARTWNTFSATQAAVRDPLAHDCVAATAIDVLDDRSATPLTPLAGQPAPAPTAFAPGGWPVASPPPPGGAGEQGWGSRTEGATPGLATGRLTTAWYELPGSLPTGGAVATLVSGRLATGNSLAVEWGRRAGTSVDVLGRKDISDLFDSTGWRSLIADDTTGRPVGADAIRLVAVDGTTDDGGWLAFTAPSVHRAVPLQEYLPNAAPIGLSWQFAFLFPCQRQPVYQNGISEPISYAVQWSDAPYQMLITEGTWHPWRGGLFGQVPRSQSMTLLTARFRDFPAQRGTQVYRFAAPYPTNQYRLTTSTETQLGL